MEDEKKQKELFEFEPRKKTFPKLSQILPRPDLDGKYLITLSLETMILIVIGIILIMITIYAVGIERGRSAKQVVAKKQSDSKPATRVLAQGVALKEAAKSGIVPNKTTIDSATYLEVKTSSVPEGKTTANTLTSAGREPLAEQKKVAVKNPALNELANPWTIVAVACRNKDIAVNEVIGLKKQGASVFIAQNGPYYLVCIGGYKNKASAQVALSRIQQKYKDAYIKLQ